MSRFTLSCALTAVSVLTLSSFTPSYAEGNNGGWFVPKTQQAPSSPPPSHHHSARPAVPPPVEDEGQEDASSEAQDASSQTPPILPLPPVPTVQAVGKEAAPPPAIIGMISVQEVMQLSTAAQEMQQVLGARRDRLARAVQKEEAAWRGEQQKLQVQARTLTSDQLQIRVRHLQERRANDQRVFGNQARIIQEAYQVAFHQIERVLEQRNGIIARVATAHGMNLVLHAEQAVLHVDGQDITEEVANRLNQVLPHVFIPDDGVDPETLAKSGRMPTTADEERMMRQEVAPQSNNGAGKSQGAESVLRQHH
ncbi:OmpH family outer membrane protein [Saccharibacter sp. 17.LH.SD]|uniref:OmpH family outer membrane protein n=1 Tax=Saccharibacter sp. 17.LH.SD TaxID=2689393 RepID=UPI0013694D88|nr:OmpH family outer membrane protein [Saccharibacter sp. 17.LH.SD]MXV44097.1 OmpH family outer membrane protein [Saccharibacter sp. 17.LH.SD]